jgi:rhomboid family protein
MSYRDSYESTDYPRITPAVQWLIAINVAVMFVQYVVFDPSKGTVQRALGFDTSHALVSWWTVLSYMFVHAGLLHLALNMYTLWIFGPRLEHNWTTRSFTIFYLWCGLGGVAFHTLVVHHGLLIGASAAVFGVMLAYGMRWPNDEVLLFGMIPIRVKWLVGLLLFFNLASGILQMASSGLGSGPAYFAHLGGLAFAWLYLRSPSMHTIDRLRQRMAAAPDIADDETPRAIPRSLPRSRQRERERESEADEIVAQSKAVAAKRPTVATKPRPNAREQQEEMLNRLLDKISENGIESLTREERDILDRVSKTLGE